MASILSVAIVGCAPPDSDANPAEPAGKTMRIKLVSFYQTTLPILGPTVLNLAREIE